MDAGGFGGWPKIDEIVDSAVFKQNSPVHCAVACASMLLEERTITISQDDLAKIIGVPTILDDVAPLLNQFDPNSGWFYGGGPFEDMNATGSWIAFMYDGNRDFHAVIIDDLDDTKNVLIRDPWDGTRYKMTIINFEIYWSGVGVISQFKHRTR